LTLKGNKDNGLAIGRENTHTIEILDADSNALLLGEFAGMMAPEGQDVMPDLASNFGMCSVNMTVWYDSEKGGLAGKIESDAKSLSIYFPRGDAGHTLTFATGSGSLLNATAEFVTPQSANTFDRDLNSTITLKGDFDEENDDVITGTFTETIANALVDQNSDGNPVPRECEIRGELRLHRVEQRQNQSPLRQGE